MSDLRQQLLKAGLVSKEAAEAANQPTATAPQPRGGGHGGAPRGGPRSEGERGGPRSEGERGGQRTQQGGGRPSDGRRGDSQGGRPQQSRASGDLAELEKAAIEREQKRLKQTPDERRKAEQAALKTARAGRIDARLHGPRRWYFHGRDGVLGWVDLSEDLANQVDQGRIAIVESPRGEAWLVGADAAAQLATVEPAWLRVWQTRN
jgi:uncharacterized protein YaiL (DUF2058 family)